MLAYVELFQGRLRDYIQESLTRGTKYLPMIQSVFRAEGLPLDLAYIPVIESGFKTNALSKASAKGPWQFMSATAQEHGLKTRLVHRRALGSGEGDGRRGASISRRCTSMFDGDWHLVLAAYNGGLGPAAARDEARRHRRFLGAVRDRRATCRARRASTSR